MNPHLLGGWPAIQAFAEGIQTQTAILEFLQKGGTLNWMIGALLVVGVGLTVWKFLETKKIMSMFWIMPMVIWISMVFSPIAVGLPTPAFTPNMDASISAAQADLEKARSWMEQAKKVPGQPQSEEASTAIRQATEDLARLEDLAGQSSGKIGEVSSAFGFVFTMANALAINLWEAIDSKLWSKVSLVDRMGQAAIAQQLSYQPGLSPEQKEVAANLAACLMAKQGYSQQLAKITKWVKDGVQPAGRSGLAGEALDAAWADVLLPTRQKAEDTCYGADDALYRSIDESITDEEVKSFTHAFTLDIPGVGKSGFWEASTDDKKKALAGEIGVTVDSLDGKTEEEIAKMFLRSQKMAALSSELQTRLESSGTGLVAQNDAGIKAAAGGWVAEAMGGFASAAEPFMKDTMNLSLKFVVAFFGVAFVLSVIPGMWKKAIVGYVFALMFVLCWQVMWLALEKHSAETMRVEIAAQGGSGSMLESSGRMIAGTWENLTGGAGVGDVVVGGVVAGKAASTSAGRAALQTFLTASKASPASFLASTALSGVVIAVDSGIDAANQLESDQANFDALVRGEIGISPALTELASGVIDVQREQLKAMHARAEMNRAGWMLASPFLTLIFLLGGWAAIALAAGMTGPMVAQIGQSLGSTMGGMATRGLGKTGGKR